MHLTRKVILLCLCLTLAAPSAIAFNQAKSKVASANGSGTLKVGSEEFKVTSIVVKLFEDGKAEINIISEITIFITGKWSRKDANSNEIDLNVSGGEASGTFDGQGKLFLKMKNEKVIDKMTLEGQGRLSQRKVTLNFVAE
jgi:hypothetical protein